MTVTGFDEEYYVCHRITDFGDSPPEGAATGKCSKCGEAILFKPYAPPHIIKVCFHCVTEMIENMPKDEPLVVLPGSSVKGMKPPVKH